MEQRTLSMLETALKRQVAQRDVEISGLRSLNESLEAELAEVKLRVMGLQKELEDVRRLGASHVE